MIIDRHRLRAGGGIAALLLAGWAALMALVPLGAGAGQQLVLIGDPLVNMGVAARAGAFIIDVSRHSVTIVNPGHGFARALYRAGADLVLLRANPAGCLSPALLKRIAAR